MKSVILIHPFQVSKEQEQNFIQSWKEVDEYMQRQDGFIETKLHRALDITPLKPFSFVNIAKWENTELFRKAISSDHFKALAKNVLVFSCGAGLYQSM